DLPEGVGRKLANASANGGGVHRTQPRHVDGAPHGIGFHGRDHDCNRGRRDTRTEHHGEGPTTRVITGYRNDAYTCALTTDALLIDLARLHAPRSASRSVSAKAASTARSSGGSARSHSSMSCTS